MDLQEDFLARPGLVPSAESLVGQLATLLKGWRDLGLPVVHSQTVIEADGTGRMPHWQRTDHFACVQGSAGALPPAALAPLPGEATLSKPFFSAFGNAELLPLLRKMDAQVLVIVGIYTHACVRATVLDAYQNHFDVWVGADGVASDDTLHADLTIRYLEQRACQFLRCGEILARLGGRAVHEAGVLANSALPSVYAGGRWRDSSSGETWTQRNPAEWGEVLCELGIGDRRDVELAARHAAAGQGAWQDATVRQRMAVLSRWSDAMQRRRDAFVALLVREIGKPLVDAEAEFGYAMTLLQAVLDRGASDERKYLAPDVWSRRSALGVVGLITPWNNPLAIPVGKIAPALAFGNTVLWKPALPAPAVVKLLLEALTEAGLPDDCIAVVLGDASTAQFIVCEPCVAAVSFTGSEAAGRQVSALCAAHGKTLQAELGGNNAVLACGDFSLEAVAAEVVQQAYSFVGQRCTAPRRLIIERHRHDEWIDCLTACIAALRIGEPADPSTKIGPLISRSRQAEIAARVRCRRARRRKNPMWRQGPARIRAWLLVRADAGDWRRTDRPHRARRKLRSGSRRAASAGFRVGLALVQWRGAGAGGDAPLGRSDATREISACSRSRHIAHRSGSGEHSRRRPFRGLEVVRYRPAGTRPLGRRVLYATAGGLWLAMNRYRCFAGRDAPGLPDNLPAAAPARLPV